MYTLACRNENGKFGSTGASVAAVAHKVESASIKWQKIPELDGIRGIAVLLVLYAHAIGLPGAEREWTGLVRWIVATSHFGIFGVDLFFVLSGCLITGILLDSRGRPHYLRNFYGRRALRIWPLYYGVLLVLLITTSNWSFIGLSVIYLSNVSPLFGIPMAYPVLWSLSVEEHFYLFWPWIVKWIPAARLAVVAMAIIVVEPFVRLAGQLNGTDVSAYSWFRLDGLAWGALLAIFIRSAWYTKSRFRLFCTVGLALGVGIIGAGAVVGIANRHSLVGAMFQFSAAGLIFVSIIGFALLAAGSRTTAILRSGIPVPVRRAEFLPVPDSPADFWLLGQAGGRGNHSLTGDGPLRRHPGARRDRTDSCLRRVVALVPLLRDALSSFEEILPVLVGQATQRCAASARMSGVGNTRRMPASSSIGSAKALVRSRMKRARSMLEKSTAAV